MPDTMTAPPVEQFRRRPTTVDTILWDGTPERARHIKAWTGRRADGVRRFLLPSDSAGQWEQAHVWNEQERDWFPVPVGHRIVRGRLGEFYAVSPDAIQATYRRTLLGAVLAVLRKLTGGRR